MLYQTESKILKCIWHWNHIIYILTSIFYPWSNEFLSSMQDTITSIIRVSWSAYWLMILWILQSPSVHFLSLLCRLYRAAANYLWPFLNKFLKSEIYIHIWIKYSKDSSALFLLFEKNWNLNRKTDFFKSF